MVTETAAVLVKQTFEPLPAGAIEPTAQPTLIADFQERLQWVASLDTEPTGTLDPLTTKAIKHFQSKHQLKATGRADAKTVATVSKIAGDGLVDPRCDRKGITLCVDKTQLVTRYVKDGTVIRTFDINIGPEQGDPKFGQYSSTREGVNPIRSKQVLSVSTSYGYEMPYWMGFDGGIGFHYSKYFDQTGYQDTSMGCTILRSEDDARWLFNNTPMGTKVVVYS
ncbi:MAG: L,D-transpeptidase family protein [Candidatus Nanopelagicales bacterium]